VLLSIKVRRLNKTKDTINLSLLGSGKGIRIVLRWLLTLRTLMTSRWI